MASPHIAALAGLMRILYPDAAPAQIEQYIKDYCQDYRLSSDYGGGIPNATAFTVTSSDPSVVEVNTSSKELVAKGSGSAVITASAGGYDKSITVNVFEVIDIEMECYDLLTDGNGKTIYWLPVGLSMGVDILYYYNGEMGSTVLPYALESSNEKVLSVDPNNFTITAVSPGKATITATMAGQTASVTLDVYPVDRSSGAWVRSDIESIAAPAAGKTSEKDYEIITSLGDGYIPTRLPTYCGAGGSSSRIGDDWEDVTDQYPDEGHKVYSLKVHLTLKGSQWNQKRTIAGIIFMFKKPDTDTSDYDPSTDILDYWVIYTK